MDGLFNDILSSTLHTYLSPTVIWLRCQAWQDVLRIKEVSELSEPILGVSAHISGGWCRNGVPPTSSGVPDFPLSEVEIYGSWCITGDSGTGKLVIYSLPHTTMVITLPLIVGPSATGLSLRIIDRVTLKIASDIPLEKLSLKYHAWHAISILPPNGRDWSQFLIELTDEGIAWGQWLAVTKPYFTKS